jgi:hypothetical protein
MRIDALVPGGLCPPDPPEFDAFRATGCPRVSVPAATLVHACPEDRALLESTPSAEAGGRTGEAGHLACPAFLFAFRRAGAAL